MPITAGLVRYERRLPKDDANSWNYKHVVAEIHWMVEEGEDDEVLAEAAVDKVVRRVKDVLNWKPAVPAELNSDTTFILSPSQAEDIAKPNIEAPDLVTAVAEITAGIPPALKRRRRTKAEMEAARAAEANPTGAPSLPEPPLSHGSVMDRIHAETEPGMPSFDPEPTPPAEVTDDDLTNACQAKASSGTLTANITALVAKFSPGRLFQTPQDARRRFLDELAKL